MAGSARKAQHAGRRAELVDAPTTPETLTIRVPRADVDVDATDLITELTWNDERALMEGTVSLTTGPLATRGDPGTPGQLPALRDGDLLELHAQRGEKAPHRAWAMRMSALELSEPDGQLQASLANELALLQATETEWVFKKSKLRPNGWRADEITRAVCAQLGIACSATLPRCRTRFSLGRDVTTGYKELTAAWARERGDTGRRFVIEFVGGELRVREPRPTGRARDLTPLTQQISISFARRPDFCTVLTAKARIHGKTQTITVRSKLADRLGVIFDTVTFHDVGSLHELRRRTVRSLAARVQPRQTISATVSGDTTLHRGQAVALPGVRYVDDVDMWIKTAAHSVTPGTYTAALALTIKDPFEDIRKAREQLARQKRAKKRAARTRAAQHAGARKVSA